MRLEQEQEYYTQNLYEASFLLCSGFKLSGKQKDGSKVRIGFSGEGVRQAALGYYNGGQVEAKAYSDAYRTLKDFIFER